MVVPSGGMRTTRAGLSKAFDFDIAMDEDNGGGGSATSHATSSSTAAGTGVSTSTGTSVSVADSSAHTGMGLGLGQSLGISLSSVSEGNITFDGSRRNSHSQVGAAMDDSAVLGYGSGKCSTPGSAKGSTTGSGKSTHGGGGGGGGGGERSRHNSLGVALPTLMHSRTSPMVSSTEQSMLLVTPRSLVQAQQSAQMAVHGAHSSSIPALAATPSAAAGSAAGTAAGTPTHTSPRGGLDNPAMHRGNLKVATNISLLGIAAINTSPAGVVHAAGSNTSTAAAVLLGTTQVHSPHSASTMSSGRSEDTPSPRIHIPPHRLQQQMGLLNTNFDGVSPRSQSLFQQYPRPQSAEKRRWLDRMNLLRGGGTGGGSGGGSGAGNMHDASSVSGLGNAIHCEHIGIAGGYYPSSSTSGGGSGGGSGADYKVVRMAEADDAASLLVYGGPEKYFHIEYMEWMGNAPFQAGVDTGDICCSSCKNTLGTWIWNPSSR